MRKTLFILITFLAISCNYKNQTSENCFYKGKDSYNREISIQQEPQRVVSLSQSITEIFFLLDAENKLIGISDFCTFPPETAKITKVGKLLNINVENILALNPDLILISSVISKDDVASLERANIPVFAVKEESKIENLYQTIQTIGTLVNRSAKADSLVKTYQQKIQSLKNRTSSNPKSVYYVVGFGKTGDFTAPGNSFIHDIITLAGGENIGKNLTTWNISREHLFQEDPDYIFIRNEDKELFCKTYPYTQLSAVKLGNVFPIPSGWIDVLSPRNFNAIEYIHNTINS